MRRGWIAAGVVAAGITFGGAVWITDPPELAPAQAADGFSFSFDADVNAPASCAERQRNCGTRGPAGQSAGLGSTTVPQHLRGATCTAVVGEQNNESIHPGTTLRVVSASTLQFNGVEDNGFNEYSGQITLGDGISVVVTLGPDGVTSLEGTVTVSCLPPPTTSTSTPPTSSVTTVPPLSSTTTSPPTPDTSTTVPVPPAPTITAPPPSSPPVSSPAGSSTSGHRCPPGTYAIGNGACAAVEESG